MGVAMLKLNASPTFRGPVCLTLPGGGTDEITVTWRHKGRAALAAWLGLPAVMAEKGQPLSDVEFLAEVIESIEIGDADGQPVPYNIDVLHTLLDQYHRAAQELFNAYQPALEGAVAKNSAGSPAG